MKCHNVLLYLSRFLTGDLLMSRLKEQWKQSQNLEFVWATSGNSSIFAHILDSHYSAPSSFDWEYAFSGGLGGSAPGALSNPTIVVQPASPFQQSNVQERADAFVMEMKRRAAWFRTDNLLVPHGDDFHYQVSPISFATSLDVLLCFILSVSTLTFSLFSPFSLSRLIVAVQSPPV